MDRQIPEAIAFMSLVFCITRNELGWLSSKNFTSITGREM